MTFEERMDRLTERHQALVESVELMGHAIDKLTEATAENTRNISALTQTVSENSRSIAENTRTITDLTQNVIKLVQVSNRDAVDIQALARIAEAHERRIEKLEGDA